MAAQPLSHHGLQSILAFLPLMNGLPIDIVGVIDGTFTISMSFRVSILKYICTLICLQVNKAQILRQAHAYSIGPLKIDLQFQKAFVAATKQFFSQRRGQINIILVNCFVLTRITDCISLHKICQVLQPGHVASRPAPTLQTSGSTKMWKYEMNLLYILKC